MFDLLVIDDNKTWQEIIQETFRGIYTCDVATTFDMAVSKIRQGQYKVICLNLKFPTLHEGRRVLTLLRDSYPKVPVVVVSGELVGRVSDFQYKFPNVREILGKGTEPSELEGSKFVQDLLEIISILMAETPRSVIPYRVTCEVIEEEEQVLSWLHLSDLHIGGKQGSCDWSSLKKALLEDILEHRKPERDQAGNSSGIVFQPDLLFVTGDIAYQAEEEQYNEARKLLEEIWEATGLGIKLGKERTFVVPGNHDVDRRVAAGDILQSTVYKTLSEADRESWHEQVAAWWNHESLRKLVGKKFASYSKFVKDVSMAAAGNLYYAKKVVVERPSGPGIAVAILGVNSAWMSWKDKEDRERGLCIGKPQLEEIEKDLPADVALRIALVHHPANALHPEDKAWQRLQEICLLILHGHTHEPEVHLSEEPEHQHVCLPGGSVFQGDVWLSQRYSYGKLNLKTGQLDIYLRRTKPGPYPCYIRDNEIYPRAASEGHLCLKIPKKVL